MNVDFVLRRNSRGRYIDLFSIFNNARHFNTECSDVEFCFWLDFVKQGLKYSENDHFLIFW